MTEREDRFACRGRAWRVVGSDWGDIIVPAAHRAHLPYEKDRWEFRYADEELLWHAAGSPGFNTFEKPKEDAAVETIDLPQPETPPTDLSWIRENLVTVDIPDELLQYHPDLVAEALDHTVVLRAEHRLDKQAIEYVLAAKRFPKRPRHERLPVFVIKTTAHFEDIFAPDGKEKIGARSVVTNLEIVPND